MPEYRVGCMGWSYEDWAGPFYPPGVPPIEYLPRYARVFSLTEVDSSFYRTPSLFLTRRWASSTPPLFRFSLKIPREVTHEAPVSGLEEPARRFLDAVAPLRDAGKLGPLVAQFPGSFRLPQGRDRLERILSLFAGKARVAVELRHSSWWVPATRELLEAQNAALVWAVVPHTKSPDWSTTDFLYARFVGDRALSKFDRVQRDLRSEMVAMKERFEKQGLSALEIYALVNNHFMGFGPGTARILQEVLGVSPADLMAAARDSGQRTLS